MTQTDSITFIRTKLLFLINAIRNKNSSAVQEEHLETVHGFSLGHLRVKEREVMGNVQIFTQNHIISGAKVSVIVFAGSPSGSQMMRLLQDRMHKQKLTVT